MILQTIQLKQLLPKYSQFLEVVPSQNFQNKNHTPNNLACREYKKQTSGIISIYFL